MAVPNLVEGYKFLMSRGDGGAPETYYFLCTVTTKGLNQTNEFDEAMLQDCDTPGLVPTRVSVPKGQTWSVSFSGKVDALRLQTIQNDMRDPKVRNYRLEIQGSGATGGGYFSCPARPETLNIESTDNGLVSFTATLRGEGDFPTWTANT